MPVATMEQQYTLESLLNDKDLRTDFIFYVNKRHAQEALLFWMEVEMFKRIVDSDECFKYPYFIFKFKYIWLKRNELFLITGKQAKLLYFRYIHPSSKSQINVEGKLKTSLEQVMATGIWDQTLYDDVQCSIHECLKYSVVREFSEQIAKRKANIEPAPITAAHVLLERYDGVVKQDKKSSNALVWLKKKTQHAFVGEKLKKDEKKASFLGKYRITRKPSKESLISTPPPSPEPSDEGDERCQAEGVYRERLSQQRLQKQIQLLRNLHQQQQIRPSEGGMYATMEFTSSQSAPLSKSISMPSIMRGLSVAHFQRT